MVIVHDKPTPRYPLVEALQIVFAPGNGYPVDPVTKRLPAVAWEGLRKELDRALYLEYPRPVCTGNGIVIDGFAIITYDEIEGKFTVVI